MKIIAIVLVSLLAGACSTRPVASCNVTPAMFCSPFAELAADLSPQDKQQLLQATPDDIVLMHHGFGTGIRNRFGLWQDNELTRFFKANGVDHPDSMLGPFITGFIGYLHGRKVVMTQEIVELPPPPPPPPEPVR